MNLLILICIILMIMPFDIIEEFEFLVEYGCEVWDGCSVNDTNRLEHIQLNAERIITRLPVFAS